jgi:hypothetical protein
MNKTWNFFNFYSKNDKSINFYGSGWVDSFIFKSGITSSKANGEDQYRIYGMY